MILQWKYGFWINLQQHRQKRLATQEDTHFFSSSIAQEKKEGEMDRKINILHLLAINSD
jgi:hypothetical protein